MKLQDITTSIKTSGPSMNVYWQTSLMICLSLSRLITSVSSVRAPISSTSTMRGNSVIMITNGRRAEAKQCLSQIYPR